MIRTKGEPGTGDIVQAVRHMRKMNSEISKLVSMREDELFEAAKQFHTNAEAAGIGEIPMTFIRAPFVESVHADASGNTPEILSIVENRIVGVKYKNQIAFAFHPELDQDTRIHETFLGMIR